MKLKGRIKKRYVVLALVIIIGAVWLWKTLNAPLPR
ncbi:hypothetical protein, partial [Cronobacter sakazakii]